MDGTHFGASPARALPIICLSHLRWNSVFQRPQQLMSRFAQEREVWFFEEPVHHPIAELRVTVCPRTGVNVVTPMLPDPGSLDAQRDMLNELLQRTGTATGWYYTPMALRFSADVAWASVVFDVMDELSAFRFAPVELVALEGRLMRRADVVFTGGASLYEARRDRHHNVHCFPSGVDLAHFMAARDLLPEPAEQATLPRPLLGYFGVIDERLDMGLLARMAALRPDWHFAMVGPVAKLTPEELPRAANIHWLGGRDYRDLPAFLSHWDVALMPFAMNEATKYISPTKAPEYLAGGRRVVSTPITDVVRRFEGIDAVAIADDAEGFIAAAELHMARADVSDFVAVDDMLATMSWDGTQARMAALMQPCERAAPALRTSPAA
ncbi:MAG: glycosyltransferase, partial [Rubritepida sp.]|nr:glycosyltransferase [Rubritepida sp.]